MRIPNMEGNTGIFFCNFFLEKLLQSVFPQNDLENALGRRLSG